MNPKKFFAELKRRNIYKVAIPVVVPITRALLRFDPTWDPLRADPDFQKLCEEKKP
jgi:hypothetical protein